MNETAQIVSGGLALAALIGMVAAYDHVCKAMQAAFASLVVMFVGGYYSYLPLAVTGAIGFSVGCVVAGVRYLLRCRDEQKAQKPIGRKPV